jgi:hypothetical protein
LQGSQEKQVRIQPLAQIHKSNSEVALLDSGTQSILCARIPHFLLNLVQPQPRGLLACRSGFALGIRG